MATAKPASTILIYQCKCNQQLFYLRQDLLLECSECNGILTNLILKEEYEGVTNAKRLYNTRP